MSEEPNFTHYGAFEITKQGLDLRQRVIAGSKSGENIKVDFTRGAIGQGRPSPDTDIFYMIEMVDHAIDVPIKESYSKEANHIMVIVIDGLKINEDVIMTEIGIFVRLIDALTGEIIVPELLYGYTYTNKYDYIPSGKSYNLHREIAFDTILSREGKFTIVYDKTAVYITRKDFDDFIDDLSKPSGAGKVGYDNSRSLLNSSRLQDAIDELDQNLDSLTEKFYRQAMTGNIQNYIDWAKEFPHVGGIRVQPLWNGANTVRVLITGDSGNPVPIVLVDGLQFYLDPNSAGLGNGVAPIGAHVTVAAGNAFKIDISADIQLADGYTTVEGVLKAIGSYVELSASINSYIDCNELTAVLKNLPGVTNILNLHINGEIIGIALSNTDVPSINSLKLEVV